jgi:hypothetical protein
MVEVGEEQLSADERMGGGVMAMRCVKTLFGVVVVPPR